MAHMLIMPARQLGDPMVFIILVVTGNGLFHGTSFVHVRGDARPPNPLSSGITLFHQPEEVTHENCP